jgi:hypothetical protein
MHLQEPRTRIALMRSKQSTTPQLADARFEPTARQLDAVARAATKVAVARHAAAMEVFYAAIRTQAALVQASLAHPPAEPARRTRRAA